jgi:hypothetical protein
LGTGFAIGFDSASISHVLPSEEETHAGSPASLPFFGSVRYTSKEDRSYINGLLDQAIWNRLAITHTAMYGVFTAASHFIKDSSFSDEKEWRLCCRYSALTEDIKFRPTQSHLIPYIEIAIELVSIREIMAGPGPHRDLKLEALKSMRQTRQTAAFSIAAGPLCARRNCDNES